MKKLTSPNTSFFVHVDKRAPTGIYEEMVESLRTNERTHFLPRHVCRWGEFGIVRATLEGINTILAMGLEFDYVVLLTGQDYPIKSNTQIQQALQERDGQSFVEYFRLPAACWTSENGGLDRLRYWHINWFGRRIAFLKRGQFTNRNLPGLWRILARLLPIQRTIPGSELPYGGSAYWCLTRDAIEYIAEFVRHRPDVVSFYHHVHVPDELFFQTVLLNSPLAGSVVNDNLRFIIWSDSPHPAIFVKRDLESLINSHKLFARKFDASIDSDVLDLIDSETV